MWNTCTTLFATNLWGIPMGMIWLLFFFIILFLIIKLFINNTTIRNEDPRQASTQTTDPLVILKTRLAKGEITLDEYITLKGHL